MHQLRTAATTKNKKLKAGPSVYFMVLCFCKHLPTTATLLAINLLIIILRPYVQ